jgi:hypothetical protein
MGASSRYWNIWRVNPEGNKLRYKSYFVSPAQEFVQRYLPSTQNEGMQSALLSYFHANNAVDMPSRAQAGLCLRCYVSDPVLKACQKIDYLFGGDKSFTYQDLLPFVLNDDGKTPVILDCDRKTQLILNGDRETQITAYKFFSIEILRTFHPDSHSMSLDNWAYLQTRQHPELKKFLSEFGFKHLTDWALLNQARPKQLERLSERNRHIVDAFHAVYRRDRRQQVATKKCLDPSSAQLQEMLTYLQTSNVVLTPVDLVEELKQIAIQLRQYDIWSHRESLEYYDFDTETYKPRSDLSSDPIDEFDMEKQELSEFFYYQLDLALSKAIKQEICDRIAALKQSKKYAPFADHYILGLELYYTQGLSLKEIAPQLNMTSWDQARRILNPGDLLSKVRMLTIQRVLDRILKKSQEKGLTQIPPEADYLKTLAEQIEAFADAEIFQQAVEEIRAGKNRSMNSVYAQQLCHQLNQYQHS